MSTRSFTARQALAGLLVAVSLPFLAVAKPPGLPVRVLVDCQTPAVQDKDGNTLFGLGVNTDAGLTGVLVPREAAFEEVIGTFCPGIGDTFEACWRTLTKWVPVTCAPGCCAEKATRLAVIEVLPNAPKEEQNVEHMQQLLDTSEDIRIMEREWERIWPSTPQGVHGGIECRGECSVERLHFRPTSVVEDNEFHGILVMLLKHAGCLRLGTLGCHEVSVLPVERLEVYPTPVPEKRSFWPRIEIKLTIEVKP